jgi:ribosomal protein L12E/L44/L45/RPP1/RPP2
VGVGTVAEDLEEVDLEEVEVAAASAEAAVALAAEAHREVGKKHGKRSNFFFN